MSIDDILISNKLDVLRNAELVSLEDIDFLTDHKEGFEKRLRTRSLFRSKFEMEAAVLREDEHPTPDSKYWQAIGEQIVQLQELITLSYESGKLEADADLLEAEIEELDAKVVSAEKGYEKKKLAAQIKRKRIELEQNRFNTVLQKKTAKERMREIVTWEGIIRGIEPNLKYGSEDFELHHPERYLLRYKGRVARLQLLGKDEQENVVAHYESFARHPDNKELVQEGSLNSIGQQRILPEEGHKTLERPKESCHKKYKDEDEMLENEPVVAAFFKRETTKILVGTPHRTNSDPNASNLHLLQQPAGMSALLEEPYGFTVADARNFIVEKAISKGFDYLFFVDDDLIIPRNALVALMEHLRKGYDVASGFYYRKYMPLESCPMIEDKKGRPSRVEFEIGDTFDNPLVICSGCTLFKVDILKKIKPPWYKEVLVHGQVQVTEDTYICQQLRSLDVPAKTILDTGVQCIHINKQQGIFYAHPTIVEKNTISEEHRITFAI